MTESVLASTAVLSYSDESKALRDQLPDSAMILEHKPIEFPNYPYEWAPEMLHAAAALTLRMASESVADGFLLKDATPYNVMFEGTRAVFIDVLSFDRREERETLWLPYAQFVRCFIYPLMAARFFGVRVDELLLVHRDGIEAARMRQLCPAWRRWLPPFLGAVTLPALLERREEGAAGLSRSARDADEATFLLERRFRQARRLLDQVVPRATHPKYMESECINTAEEFASKESAVAEALARERPATVLDVGCNTGYFSRIAAQHGARVVAIDSDPDSVGAVWRSAENSRLPILPLVINIARPPGGCGWSNQEFPSFLDRARGRFECVLMLAVIHHLMVTERVPLEHILELAAELTTRLAIIEYVDPTDPQFQLIARGRDALHRDLNVESFEKSVRRIFEVVDSRAVTPTRRVYILENGRPEVLRRVAICLAFSTWCFSNTWVKLAQGDFLYFARYDPNQTLVLPILGWEVLLTGAMLLTWRVLRGQISAAWLFLLTSLVPLGIGAVALVNLTPANLGPLVTSRLFWPIAGVLAIAPVIFAVRYPRRASALLGSLFLYSWPVLAVMLTQAVRVSVLPYRHRNYADRPLAPYVATMEPKIRVVWIVFDEMSQSIAFGNRPSDLDLPNFDRLRAEAFYATSAEPPASFTKASIPSLILGEHVDVAPNGPDELMVRGASEAKAAPWMSRLNVFDSARQMGFNTSLAGWYHPYGRLLNTSLEKCFWTAEWLPPGVEEPSVEEPLLAAMGTRARLQFAALPLVNQIAGARSDADERMSTLQRFQYLRDRALELVADPLDGLIFIHLPVPHPPAIYDRHRREFVRHRPGGYLDNLALADATLGLLRQKMEDARVWDRTAVLVSSDHSWRPSIWRDQHDWSLEDELAARSNSTSVPFLLRLPGQISGITYSEKFDTVVTRRIITAILAGRLTGPGQIASFVEMDRP